VKRKIRFWKVKNKIVYNSLTLFLILLLTVGSFQTKGVRDSSPLDKGKVCERVTSSESNGTGTNYPVYLAPTMDVSLIGVIPAVYGQWIAHLIRESAWRATSRVYNLLPCYLPKRLKALFSHYPMDFLMNCLGSIKIRE